jgi:outer membrane protein TolC
VVLAVFASGRPVFGSEQMAGQQPAVQPPAAPMGQQQAAEAGSTLKIAADEAVRMALENNLGIQTERLNPQIQSLAVSRALGAYSPTLFGNINRTADTAPPTDFLSTGATVVTASDFSSNGGLTQQLPWGGAYQVAVTGARNTTDAPRTVFSPRLNSSFTAIYDQPLLRNFTIDGFRQQVLLSRNQQDVADIQLAERITQTSRTVRNAYYDLIGAISGLEVANQSLELARQSLRNNQRRVEVGTMAPIDIVEAEAEVARNEENVIVAEGRIRTAEDRLRTLVMNPSQPDFWTTRLEPSEQPVLAPQPVDVEGAVRNALANRTDLAQLRKQIETTDINIKFNKSQRLPAVNLRAAYGTTGVGGTQFQYGQSDIDGGVPPIIGSSQRSFADVLRDVFGNEFNNWSLGVQINYPLGTSSADAALAQSRLERQQTQVSLREAEVQITAAVREAGRQVMTSLKRVEATRKARELAERRLEAEEKRLAVGLSDTFRLFQAQRDLASQRQAELNAVLAYNRALVDFEAVQTVPLGGGGF